MAEVRKKNKCKSKHKDSEEKDVLEEVLEEGATKHKHKKKKKDVQTIQQVIDAQLPVTAHKLKKHKKKQKSSDAGCSDSLVQESPILERKKKHKKKKHQAGIEDSGYDVTLDIATDVTEHSKKKSKKRAHHCMDSGSGEQEKEECSHRKKKHKKHDMEVMTHKLTNGLNNDSVSEKRIKIKKQKRRNENENSDCSSNSTEQTNVERKRKKKRKAEHSVASANLNVVPADEDTKKAKKERKHKHRDKDDTLQQRHGEENRVEKRKKKHKDHSVMTSPCGDDTTEHVNGLPTIKQANGTTPGGAPPRFLGQWATAELSTGDRQNKFFRLLGGFKASSDQKTAAAGSFNSALTADKETLLNKTLETQFDNALSYGVNRQRGGGLGYSAPPGENKKFYIDRTSSKSIKFDD